jgi:hypothetical protein
MEEEKRIKLTKFVKDAKENAVWNLFLVSLISGSNEYTIESCNQTLELIDDLLEICKDPLDIEVLGKAKDIINTELDGLK